MTKKTPYKGPGADSEEKHEPASDIDTVLVDSLKALDPNRPIREADIMVLQPLLNSIVQTSQSNRKLSIERYCKPEIPHSVAMRVRN